jgi:hypothetical protein
MACRQTDGWQNETINMSIAEREKERKKGRKEERKKNRKEAR